MGTLGGLIAAAGRWTGTSKLQDPHGPPDESSATATVTPVLGGKFVRLDYTWAYHDAPQEGSLLLGHDAGRAVVTGHWIDTWHMGDKVMALEGAIMADGAISLRGSYAAPPGPDWGWRIDLTPEAKRLTIVMYNITPDGREDLAVEAELGRTSG